MFQFTRFPLSCKDMTLYRLLHSEILASTFVCNFAKLIAAYHVLLRLFLPRHPLCALCFRSISIGQLNTLLRVHPQPIQLLFSKLPLRILILKLVSRLDAFSGYLCQT